MTTFEVSHHDILHQGKSVKFDHDARLVRIEREDRGHGDRYEQLQPAAMPTINRGFIGTRVDVCFEFILDEGGVELTWCQGKVIDISDGYNIMYPNARSRCYRKGEAVKISWDAIDGISEIYESI